MTTTMRQPWLPRWRHAKPIIGMVHLPPLPGSPRWQGSMQAVLEAAARDAEALAQGGVDGIIVE
ncbi:MAG: BtpA/SgcQ family protein, partial [Gemmatimonadota bacterium]